MSDLVRNLRPRHSLDSQLTHTLVAVGVARGEVSRNTVRA
jgi:hypothetical protein